MTTATAELTAGTWAIEPVHSQVEFVIRHLGLSKVRGRFNEFGGTVTVADDLTMSSVDVTVDMASVDTNNEDRDNHLRSTDIFGADNHPQMSFKSTSITGTGPNYALNGDLTINGVTKQAEFAVEFGGVAADGYGVTRAGFSAKYEISRKDYGIDFNVPLSGGGLLLADNVKIELEIQIVQA